MAPELLAWAARELSRWLAYWDTHCWSCERERDYDAEPVCPGCGADTTPF